jgi:putative spermidine/putrescine transport system substrate-binding protein
MADGVPFNKVYPIDVKRAFKKLDTIKSDTIFWNTGAQSEQLLSSGQVDFEIGWNNRFGYLVQAGAPVGIEYNQNLQIKDYSTISLHEPNYELCVEFLKAAMDPQAQAKFAELSGNAPSVRAAYKYLDAKTKARMSTNPVYLKQAVGAINDNWWGSHINSITNQWNAWV